MATKSFVIQKDKVLNALRWLKLYNLEYSDIFIDELNLDWISRFSISNIIGKRVTPFRNYSTALF